LKPEACVLRERCIDEVAQASVHDHRRYPMLHNHAAESALCRQVITDWPGPQGVAAKQEPRCGAEDFAFFLEQVPGCYLFIGIGNGNGNGDGDGDGDGARDSCMTHHAGYDFHDRVLSTGASHWVRLAEACLPSC
jgi:hippurate hydrolase